MLDGEYLGVEACEWAGAGGATGLKATAYDPGVPRSSAVPGVEEAESAKSGRCSVPAPCFLDMIEVPPAHDVTVVAYGAGRQLRNGDVGERPWRGGG